MSYAVHLGCVNCCTQWNAYGIKALDSHKIPVIMFTKIHARRLDTHLAPLVVSFPPLAAQLDA